MTNSFFPRKDAELVVWANNYKTKIAVHAATLGLTQPQVDAEVALCNNLIDAVNVVNVHRNDLKSSIQARIDAVNNQGGGLRAEIGRHKTAIGYTNAIGQDLNVVGAYVGFDVNTFKPKISTELFGGNIRIKFRKLGADGVNLYHRKKGTTAWLFLTRTTKSPFENHLVLATPGQPEHWEYRAFGVLNDNEIGTASDIVEVIFGG
jgi:hypothetical protein